jgi:hypothetical protein
VLYLVRASKERFECISTLNLFGDLAGSKHDVRSHPALIEGRLYVRNLLAVYCSLLK